MVIAINGTVKLFLLVDISKWSIDFGQFKR